MQRSAAIDVQCVAIDHGLITKIATNVKIASSACKMQRQSLLLCDSSDVNALLDEGFEDVAVPFVASVVQRRPLVGAFRVDVGHLQHLLRWVKQVEHRLHVAFLRRKQVVLVVLSLDFPEIGPGLGFRLRDLHVLGLACCGYIRSKSRHVLTLICDCGDVSGGNLS